MTNKPKVFKVLIEVPEDWLDAESPVLFASTTIRDEVLKIARDEIVKKVIANTPIPELNITKEEILERVVDKLAEQHSQQN